MGGSLGRLFIIFHKLWKPTELFLKFGLGSNNVHTVLNNEYMGFTEKNGRMQRNSQNEGDPGSGNVCALPDK